MVEIIDKTSALADDVPIIKAADIPPNFSILTIPNRSDKRLNTARINCAFGDMPKVFAEVRAAGFPTPPVADFCVAVIDEAVKRGNQADLYSAMQPNHSLVEFDRIVQAAASDAKEYVNAEGVRKIIGCEIAYDAARVHESYKPEAIAVPPLDADRLAGIRQRCYDPGVNEARVNGFIAGIIDQQAVHAAKQVSETELGEQSRVLTPDGTEKAAKGAVIGN